MNRKLTNYEKEIISTYRKGYYSDNEFIHKMTAPEWRGGTGKSEKYGKTMLSIAKKHN